VVFTIAALALLALVGLVLGVYLVPMAHDEVSFLSVKAFGPSGKTTFNVNATIPNGITDPEWNDVFAARRLPAGLWVALGITNTGRLPLTVTGVSLPAGDESLLRVSPARRGLLGSWPAGPVFPARINPGGFGAVALLITVSCTARVPAGRGDLIQDISPLVIHYKIGPFHFERTSAVPQAPGFAVTHTLCPYPAPSPSRTHQPASR
jgi:hypothetical protein